MSRLTEKLKMASGVVARSYAKIEADADSLIAMEADVDQKRVEAFTPHKTMLSEAKKDMEELAKALALVSNNPLESSGDSQEGEKEPVRATSPDLAELAWGPSLPIRITSSPDKPSIEPRQGSALQVGG